MIDPAPSLEALYASHVGKVSDKWQLYLGEYGRLFEEYQRKPVRMLEIGIQNGGSLDIWSRYFLDARVIVGCDVDPNCALLEYGDPKVRIVIGDATSERVRERVLQHSEAFDLVVDDGSHRTSDIIGTFARYFPVMAEGGMFVVEDLHCSYWKEFEGGLFDPYSSIAFFKRLADVPNQDHWGVNKSPADLFSGFHGRYGHVLDDETLQHVHSVEFINSMCVVRRRDRDHNRLGRRVIVGTVEAVAGGHLGRHGTEALPSSQFHNEWSVRDIPPDEEVAQSSGQLALHGATLGKLRLEIEAREADVFRLTALVDERVGNVHAVDQRLKALEQTLAERDAQAAEQAALIGEREATLLQLTASLDRRAELLSQLQCALGQRDARVGELITILGERDSQISTLAGIAADGERRAERAEQALTQRDEQLGALMRALSERDAVIVREQAAVSQRIADNGELSSRLNAANAQVGDMSANLTLRDAELEGIRRTAVQQEKHVDRLHRTIALRDGEFDRQQTRQERHERMFAEQQQAIAQRDLRLEGVQRSLKAAHSQIAEQLEFARAGLARLEQAGAVAASRAAEVEALQSALRSRDEQLALVRRRLAEFELGRWTDRIKRQIDRLRGAR